MRKRKFRLGLSRTGLLFVSVKTYESRIWDAAYNFALQNGKTPAEAAQIADDALKATKATHQRNDDAADPNS